MKTQINNVQDNILRLLRTKLSEEDRVMIQEQFDALRKADDKVFYRLSMDDVAVVRSLLSKEQQQKLQNIQREDMRAFEIHDWSEILKIFLEDLSERSNGLDMVTNADKQRLFVMQLDKAISKFSNVRLVYEITVLGSRIYAEDANNLDLITNKIDCEISLDRAREMAEIRNLELYLKKGDKVWRDI